MEKTKDMVKDFMKLEESKRLLLQRLRGHCSVVLDGFDDEFNLLFVRNGIEHLAKIHGEELTYADLDGREDDVVGQLSFVSEGVSYIQYMTREQRTYFIGKAMMDWDEDWDEELL